uniref:Protein Vpu n=1 Tax=Human immunodeficiency virus type 1 TaxID=11676 RepID=A0A6M6B074_HV1|nr:vpu protein [Human immunodeficiency virus 1]
MLNLLARVDYKVRVRAFIVALILTIVVWIIAYIEYKKLLRQKKINRLIKRIKERQEDSGNESDEDHKELSTMVDIRQLRLLDANSL